MCDSQPKIQINLLIDNSSVKLSVTGELNARNLSLSKLKYIFVFLKSKTESKLLPAVTAASTTPLLLTHKYLPSQNCFKLHSLGLKHL